MEQNLSHPKGEKRSSKNLTKSDLLTVDTFGGKVQIRWDKNASLNKYKMRYSKSTITWYDESSK